MSVTTIEHNQKEKNIEITSKIFTDDFEKALRANFKTKIDLLDVKQNKLMDKYVSSYLQSHLKLQIDGKIVSFNYVGFEKIEDAINVYAEVEKISTIKNLEVTDNILYEYKSSQISLIHSIVAGKRQSTKLTNPEKTAKFSF